VQTGHVSPDLAAGERPGATRIPFTIGDTISAQVDVGTGNLYVTGTQLTLRRINRDALNLGLAYNGLTLAPGSRFSSSISPGWRFSTGSDVRLKGAGGGRYVVYAVAYPAIGIGAAIVGCGIGGWVAYANGEIITP
jgi:hypothetical protein